MYRPALNPGKPEIVNALFSKESRLNVSNAVLDRAASVEPNRWESSFDALRLDLTTEDMQVLQSANKFLLERDIIKQPVDVKAHIDLGPLEAALSRPALQALADKIELIPPAE